MGKTTMGMERKKHVEQKLKESGERLSVLSDWLYDNTTSATGTEYETKLAEYYAELRRYYILECEYAELNGEQISERKRSEQLERANISQRNKIRY